MKLARALKEKNRKVEKISQLRTDIQDYNSLPKVSEREVDVKTLMEEQDKCVQDLIDFKMKIFEATEPIRKDIIRIAELKSANAFLKNISTKKGAVMAEMYRTNYLLRDGKGEVLEYNAVFSKDEISSRIFHNERDIDLLQEKIDQHNYTTDI